METQPGQPPGSGASSPEEILPEEIFWRVEGSLVNLRAVRPVAFFIWNAQNFSERWGRRGALGLLALVRPFLYVIHRVFATRVLHTLLRGVSRDRLDLLGEEYFEYVMKPRLKRDGVEKLRECMAGGGSVVLVSQGLNHVMRPLAEYLSVHRLIANRLEFRDGLATGRLLEPVIPPRGGLARLRGGADGRIAPDQLLQHLRWIQNPALLQQAVFPARRRFAPPAPPRVLFDPARKIECLSVRKALSGKNILLIGVTGFIGKVWLVHMLEYVPDVGKIYLLIRRQGPKPALRRFEQIVEESPLFDAFYKRHGESLGRFLAERVEVIEGDVCKPGLGIEPETLERLREKLDLIVNSSGLTDFNPDLREALAVNVDGTMHCLDLIRQSGHAALLHLSTCYVAGARDGRVAEELVPDYTPTGAAGFDAEQEWHALQKVVRTTEEHSQSATVTEDLRRHALGKGRKRRKPSGDALEQHIQKARARWLRSYLTKAGARRAKELGWPNTYTLTKSLAESLLRKLGGGLPVAIVRPSIVETSIEQPFRGWNEGINTSAPLSYLLGTYFRFLPTNERKCLDLIPVDLVCRGMSLIAAALVERRHEQVYQLATSGTNPCDMRRAIELTSLAHRKHYRAQEGFEHKLLLRFDTIPVSKKRYQRFSAPRQRAIIQALQKTAYPLPFLKPSLARTERSLIRVEKLIELYEPFILHNDHVFVADNAVLLSEALPPEERGAFGYDASCIDWWEYWINIHVPAQRKWSYPLIEGRALASRPRRSFHLNGSAAPEDAKTYAGRPADSA